MESEQLISTTTEKKNTGQRLFFGSIMCIAIIAVAVFLGVFLYHGSSSSSDNIVDKPFGKIVLNEFGLDSNYTNLNFGSYGSVPIDVQNAQKQYRYEMESCLGCWFGSIRRNYYEEVRGIIANYLNIEDQNDVVFVDNASHGCNSVIRTIIMNAYNTSCANTTCKVIYLNSAYYMVKTTIQYMSNIYDNVEYIEININNEMLNNYDMLLEYMEDIISSNENGTILLGAISHIVSAPAVILPIQRINNLFRKYGIICLIDGAHAIGQIKLDFNELDLDVYITNGHKWLYSPKGSAIMYVNKDIQSQIYPTVIFNYNGKGLTSFQNKFDWYGTKDVTNIISMKDAILFRQSFGEDRIIDYIHNLAINGGNEIINIWGTNRVMNNDDNIGAMVNIRFPTQNKTEIDIIMDTMFNEYNTFVPIIEWLGVYYARISAQIFVDLDDFIWYANSVLNVLNDMHV